MNNVTEVFQTFKTNIAINMPGLIAMAIIDIKTGITYMTHSNDSNFDPELAAAYNLDVARSKLKAVKALGLNEKIQDILISLESQIHVIDISDDEQYLIYLAVSSEQSNLGMTRAFLKKHKKDLVGLKFE